MTPTEALAQDRLATLTAPRYTLLLSSDREHRTAAQRLRYQVFAAEPGFESAVRGITDGLDADHFDEYSDHLLVRDELTDEVVGCYRMLTPDAATAAGGLYAATEFDVSALDLLRPGLVEMGRACVHPDHRTGSVLGLMWAGILNYLDLTGYRWAMGCVSVPMRALPDDVPGANVRAVRDLLLAGHATAPDRRVRPIRPVPMPDAAPTRSGRAVLPPLLRGYLRLGAKVCGEPAHDPDFGVADFVALLGMDQANDRYLDRLRSVAAQVPVITR
ncbi:GNAT family N-acetyltransferase [Rhodococcus spelaei]|uniref:GNAT family N-acetyltransferase n=1 Tax=Rhodococcus spelaei TaxID=2546320 RepID=A0A541B4F3_9NOCA|nr:GNAT family N-acyltransferase [Rhodococcus spelaei]TQF67197.1 GNAT family N-acetyltransferase [Rhodococcus spelaei]